MTTAVMRGVALSDRNLAREPLTKMAVAGTGTGAIRAKSRRIFNQRFHAGGRRCIRRQAAASSGTD